MTAAKTAGNESREWSGDGSICDQQVHYVTISDGVGGVLSLDLTEPGLDELARACNALLTGEVPPGACLMRVWVGDDAYLLRRVKRLPTSIGITRLGAQNQGVSLSGDVLSLLIELIEQTQHLRASPSDRASQRSDD